MSWGGYFGWNASKATEGQLSWFVHKKVEYLTCEMSEFTIMTEYPPVYTSEELNFPNLRMFIYRMVFRNNGEFRLLNLPKQRASVTRDTFHRVFGIYEKHKRLEVPQRPNPKVHPYRISKETPVGDRFAVRTFRSAAEVLRGKPDISTDRKVRTANRFALKAHWRTYFNVFLEQLAFFTRHESPNILITE